MTERADRAAAAGHETGQDITAEVVCPQPVPGRGRATLAERVEGVGVAPDQVRPEDGGADDDEDEEHAEGDPDGY